MIFAITLILLVIGSVLFHFLSPWYLTPLASNWGTIDTTINITFWVTGTVFVAINLFMAWCVIKFRHKKGRLAHYEPENKKLEIWLTVVTSIGVAAMLTPGLYVWAKFVTPPENADVVEVVGKQWQWSYRFPGEDGSLGTVDSRHISSKNPFGMNPDDPTGQDDILVSGDEVHLPIDRPVKLLLRSQDVLHDFAVAQIRVKMDLVPGLVTYLWFTPTKVGKYDVLCEELCGVGHYKMRSHMVIDEEGDFKAWLKTHPTYAQTVYGWIDERESAGKAQLYPHQQGHHQRYQANCYCGTGILDCNDLGVLAEDIFTEPGFRVVKPHLRDFSGRDKIIRVVCNSRHLECPPRGFFIWVQ